MTMIFYQLEDYKIQSSETLTFDIESGEMVQILNSGGNHWIAINTIEAKPQYVSTQEHDNGKRRVRVYDSLYRDMPFETKDQIAALLQCKDKNIILEYANVQVSYSYLCLCCYNQCSNHIMHAMLL